jgi:hypothetical protein
MITPYSLHPYKAKYFLSIKNTTVLLIPIEDHRWWEAPI